MKYSIDDLSAEELTIIALAVEYYLCNEAEEGTSNLSATLIYNLFMHLDQIAEKVEEELADQRIKEKHDNLLVVDFKPKDS